MSDPGEPQSEPLDGNPQGGGEDEAIQPPAEGKVDAGAGSEVPDLTDTDSAESTEGESDEEIQIADIPLAGGEGEGEEAKEKRKTTIVEPIDLDFGDEGGEEEFAEEEEVDEALLKPKFYYTKRRYDFGLPVALELEGPFVVVDIPSNPEMKDTFQESFEKNVRCQVGPPYSYHTVQTPYLKNVIRADNHREGGWPGEVDFRDEDQKTKFVNDETLKPSLRQSLPNMYQNMSRWMCQNTFLNIYERYFDPAVFPQSEDVLDLSATVMCAIPCPESKARVCNSLHWCCEGDNLMAAAYCVPGFYEPNPLDLTYAYVWDIYNFTQPRYIMRADYPVCVLRFNHRDPNLIAGGLTNGQIVLWDLREDCSNPQVESYLYDPFRHPVTSIRWITSRSGMELFCSSTDGNIRWFDARDMSTPLEEICMDLSEYDDQSDPKYINSYGINCLDYDFTIPTKYIVGTESGKVYSGNRKGRELKDKFPTGYSAHLGPVRSVGRNRNYNKIFLTSGSYEVKIWTEECKDSPIIWMKYSTTRVLDTVWSPTKFSLFHVCLETGYLDSWDLMLSFNEPSSSIKLSDGALTCISPHDDGRYVAVGDEYGVANVLKFSDAYFELTKAERQTLSAWFERESKREKIIEVRLRELRLRARMREAAESEPSIPEDEKAAVFTRCQDGFWEDLRTVVKSHGKSIKKRFTASDEDV